MVLIGILMLALSTAPPTSTPGPTVTPASTATPWTPRRPPTAKVVPFAEPTALPRDMDLSDVAGKLKLKREADAPIIITGHGTGGCLIPSELRALPQPAGIAEVGAHQMGRAIRVWFWMYGETGKEVRAAVCTTLEIWSRQQEIYHFERLLIPEDFSDLTLGSLLKPDEHHLGVVFRDRAFEEFLSPPSGSVNIVVRVRVADGHSFQSGVTLSLTP